MKTWIIVPGAGTGSRFSGDAADSKPKQYQSLLGKPVIVHTLERLSSLNPHALVVAVNPADKYWQALDIFKRDVIRTTDGGAERSDSVYRALCSIWAEANPQDWVLVHDVARPCVRIADILKLQAALKDHPVGGILATPVSDTVKRVADSTIEKTEDRSQLWAAQTPQMFRYGLLHEALKSAAQAGQSITVPTDEAEAIERMDYKPVVVEGSRDNIKITRREDMVVAETIIQYQEKQP